MLRLSGAISYNHMLLLWAGELSLANTSGQRARV